MAHRNLGGRPRLAWTASRRRRLVRLYLLTDLNVKEIRRVFGAEGFNLCTGSIHTQLRDLLPNVAKERQQYRPSGTEQRINRLAQLKRCKANKVLKHYQQRPKPAFNFNAAEGQTEGSSHPQSIVPFYDPSCHFNVILPAGVPSHVYLPELGAWYLHRSPDSSVKPFLMEGLVKDQSSYKEAVTTVTQQPDIDFIANQTASVEARPEPNESKEIENSTPALSTEAGAISYTPRGLKRSHSRLDSIPGSSIRSLSVHISTLVSRSVNQATSVLSASDSWRSSLVYAMSIASDAAPSANENQLSTDEARCWDTLVNESALVTTVVKPRDYEAISLETRPCCEFFENDTYKRTLCEVCGFSETHQMARSSLSDDCSSIDAAVTDRFGNTPLHHAAAAGNTTRVMQLIEHDSQPPARNASGQTFLHVLDVKGDEHFQRFLEVLKKASSLRFPFYARDYMGRNVSQRLLELTEGWVMDDDQRNQVIQIIMQASTPNSSPPKATVSRPKTFNPTTNPKRRTSNLQSNRNAFTENFEVNNDTRLISTLKAWKESPRSLFAFEEPIQYSEIHMRDQRGYTALAIAVRYGNRAAASFLLKHGANPNTRSYQKTSVYAHAAAYLARAQKEQNHSLYAGILSCMVLLTDHGAKVSPTVFDEYAWTPSSSETKGMGTERKTAPI